MDIPKEDRQFYMTEAQRKVLLELIKEPVIAENFFLTGGTALSVFYIYHRRSNDIDLFTLNDVDLPGIALLIKKTWQKSIAIIKESSFILSCLIDNTKVDIVIDPLSFDEIRPVFTFENGYSIKIDSISNIVSNKLTACVSRIEPKDYIDLYIILKHYPEIQFNYIYSMAQKKDAIFDDPPTVAFQIEEGIAFLKKNRTIMPPMSCDFDYDDFTVFFEKLTKWIYGKLQI